MRTRVSSDSTLNIRASLLEAVMAFAALQLSTNADTLPQKPALVKGIGLTLPMGRRIAPGRAELRPGEWRRRPGLQRARRCHGSLHLGATGKRNGKAERPDGSSQGAGENEGASAAGGAAMGDGEGKCVWLFPDGDLPPPGEPGLPLEGHESLIILNTGDHDAQIELDVYFTDREPEIGLKLSVPARRVKCFRLDKPVGDRAFQIPYGQYALRVRSNVPVVAQIGRADVRQPNLAYYTTLGYPAE